MHATEPDVSVTTTSVRRPVSLHRSAGSSRPSRGEGHSGGARSGAQDAGGLGGDTHEARDRRLAHARDGCRGDGGGAFLPPQTGDRHTVYDVEHGGRSSLPGRKVRGEGDPPADDPAVNEAYEGSDTTHDFYKDVYGRESVDGNGMELVSSVHYGSASTTRSGTAVRWCTETEADGSSSRAA